MAKTSQSEVFYGGALDRIRRTMIVVGVILSAAGGVRFGWRLGLGLALGSALAYLNFYWLKQVVEAMGERITESRRQRSARGIVLRFLLRYVWMSLAAYAILRVSAASLYGLFAGLFLPVVAIACEAAYELYMGMARGL